MFETSEGNGWLIEQLAQALPHPMATSMTMEVYRLMPNDTDFTIFMKHGMPGLNFAFIGGLYYYHSPEDTPANLDPRRFSIKVRTCWRWPGTWSGSTSTMSVATMSFIISVLAAVRGDLSHGLGGPPDGDRRAGVPGGDRPWAWRVDVSDSTEIVVGFGVFLLSLLGAVLAADLLWLVVRDILLSLGVTLIGFEYPLLPIFSIVAVLVAGAIFVRAGRRWSWEGLGLGILGWWLAATAATSLWLPGDELCVPLAFAGDLWPVRPSRSWCRGAGRSPCWRHGWVPSRS